MGEGEKGRRGEREKGRKGEGEKGRRGEREKGRRGEWEKGRRGEREKGRRGEWEKGRSSLSLLVSPSPIPPLPLSPFRPCFIMMWLAFELLCIYEG